MPKSSSVFNNIYHGAYRPYDRRYDLFKCTKDSLDYVQSLEVFKRLAVHQGCVNTISWSESGEVLLSGSDDQHLCITNGSNYKTLVNLETAHRANIFSAKFLPNCGDRKIVSCSGDGLIIYTDLDRPEGRTRNSFNCHHGTAYKVVTIPNEPSSFMSCGEDGTVRWFDLRMKNSCSVENCREDVLLSYPKSVTALAVDQVFPYQFAIGCCDSSVGIYDRRVLGTKATDNFNPHGYQGLLTKFSVPAFEGKSYRITSLAYSADCRQVLVSYSSENLFLFDIKSFHNGSDPKLRAVFGTQDSVSGSTASASDWSPTEKRSGSSAPPMKRLRLRGDWSDTGPNARPNVERELRDDGQMRLSFHAHLMQHVSTVLTRMLNEQPEAAGQALVGRLNGVTDATPRGALDPESGNDPAAAAADEELEVATSRDELPSEPLISGESQLVDTQDYADVGSGAGAGAGTSSTTPPSTTNLGFGLPCVPVSVQIDLPSLDSSDMDESEDGEAVLSSLMNSPDAVDFRIDLPVRSVPRHRTWSDDTPVPTSSDNDRTRTTPVSMDLASSESEPDTSGTSGGASGIRPRVDHQRREQVDSITTTTDRSSVPEATSDGDEEVSDDEDEVRTSSRHSAFVERTRRLLKTSLAQPSTSSPDDQLVSEREKAEEDLEEAFIRRLPQPVLRQKYTGHRNARTMIKEANFWGTNYVMSGSDCGHVFIWNRVTAELVMILEADRRVVNCVQPHPFDPVLATSGIDYDVKLWAPGGQQPSFDAARAAELTSRNEVMLEETRDTITVPASFMIRMLASFNHLRQSSPIARWRQSRQANRPRED